MYPALRSRFLTTGPLGKALQCDLELFIDWFCWSRQQTFEKHWSMVFNFNFTLESLQLKERDCQREREATLGTHFRPKSLGWSWNICAFYKLPKWCSCAARVENYESRSTSSLSVLRDVTCARSLVGKPLGAWNGYPLHSPVFLPGQFHGQRRLAGYSPWDRKELDMTEQLTLSPYDPMTVLLGIYPT